MTASLIDLEKKYCAHNYEPLPVVLTKGQGVYVWDESGKKYIDMMGAYSAVSHGHCHPKLIKALKDQAEKLTIVSRAFYTDTLGAFLKRVCELTKFKKALPMNTGVEAVETAIKAARKWAYTIKKVPTDQAEIIACQGNFHGRTLGVIGLSSVPQYQHGFGPFLSGLRLVPYGDADSLEQAITANTAAFLVEPIQGEGGINVPSSGYLKRCAEICKKHHVLMICDEVQTGLGRTGKLMAYEHDDFQPDAIILGKALGGGMFPVSLFLAQEEVMQVFTPGDHGSTFGGNPLAAAIGLKAIDVLIEERLIENAAEMGNYFLQQLKTISSPIIKEIRGKGLLIGLEIDAKYDAHHICLELLKSGILTKETHKTVIRFAPPLIIGKKEIDETVKILKMIFSEMI